jgi:hypothetical protein
LRDIQEPRVWNNTKYQSDKNIFPSKLYSYTHNLMRISINIQNYADTHILKAWGLSNVCIGNENLSLS